MSDRTLYFNIETGKLITQAGGQLTTKPTISYQAQPSWEIHFVTINPEDGSLVGVDHSSGVAWKVAVDTDFDANTVPMMRTLDSGINKDQTAQGIIIVDLDANTETFLAKVNKSSGLTATLEIRGTDSDGKIIYDYRFQITCLGAIDPNSTDPIPIPSATVTQEWVLGNLRKAPQYQFSVDGVDWHTGRQHEDLYYQTRYPEGEWSESIQLINGADGYAPTIEIGEVITADPSGVVSIENVGTPDAAIWNISIPRGKDGRSGWAVNVGTVTTGEPGTEAKVEYTETVIENIPYLTLDFTIPRGDPGKDGETEGGMTDAERAKLLPDATTSGQVPMWDGSQWLASTIEISDSGSTEVPENVLTEDDLGVTVPNLSGGYILSSQLPMIPSSRLYTIPSSLMGDIPSGKIYGYLPISKISDLQNQLNLRRLTSESYSKTEVDTMFSQVDTSTFVGLNDYNAEMNAVYTSITNLGEEIDSKLSRTIVWDNGEVNGDLTIDGKRGDYQIITIATDGVVALAESSFQNFDAGDSIMLEVNKTAGSVFTYGGNIILTLTDEGTFLFGIFNNGTRFVVTAPTEAL